MHQEYVMTLQTATELKIKTESMRMETQSLIYCILVITISISQRHLLNNTTIWHLNTPLLHKRESQLTHNSGSYNTCIKCCMYKTAWKTNLFRNYTNKYYVCSLFRTPTIPKIIYFTKEYNFLNENPLP